MSVIKNWVSLAVQYVLPEVSKEYLGTFERMIL